MTKIPVILWPLLFAIVSSKVPSQTWNKYIVEQKGPETWLERVNIVDGQTISNDVGRKESSLEDGRQKSRANEAGLTRWEMGSVQEASSGTDWGGLLLRLADRQESAGEKRNLPPLISLLRRKLKMPDLTIQKSQEDRQRRSLQDFPVSDYMVLMGNPNNDDEIRKILANAKAQLSTVKSGNMGKFRNNGFGDDWLFFVLPFRSGMGFTESLLRPSNMSYEMGIQNWNENEKWVDDTKFLNTKQFLENNEYMEVDQTDALRKIYESSLSKEARNAGYSGELTETSWTTEQTENRYKKQHPESRAKETYKDGSGTVEEKYETALRSRTNEAGKDGSGTSEEKHETDAGSPTKDIAKDGSGRTEEKHKEGSGSRLKEAGKHGSDTQANKTRLMKNDEHWNENGNYRDAEVNVDIKNEETLFDDISIDDTMDNVVGIDKLSTVELPVKILQVYDKTNQNKRPSNDKSLFISDPLVSRTKWQGGSRHEKEDEESNSIKVDQNMQGGRLISNETRDEESHRDVKSSSQGSELTNKETQESYGDSKLSNDETDFNESMDILRATNKMDEKMISMEKKQSIVARQGEKDSSELEIPQLLDESSDLREQMRRQQNLYEENEKNLSLNSSRIDGSAATDTRKGIHQEYDKQKSAAETSIRVDANKRGRGKHRERIGTKSTSTEEMRAENEERRKSLNHDGQQNEMQARNVSSAARADYRVDSDENVKLERTSLGERQKTTADAKSREEKSDAGNLKEERHEIDDPETTEFEFDANGDEFEIENLKNAEFKMEYLRRKYSEEKNLRMQKSDARNGEDIERGEINRRKFGLEDIEKEKSTEQSNKKEEHDISGTKKTKFQVENSQGEELRLQDVNEGDKLESKGLKRKKFDPEISAERKFEAESSQMGNVKLDFGSWNVAGQKFESEDLQKEKSEERNVDNDKFEAGGLKEKEVGSGDRGETEYDPIEAQKNKSGLMKVETEDSQLSIEIFKPQFPEDNLLLISDEVSTKNDKNIERFDPRDTQINIKEGQKILQQDKESSEKENDEFNKNAEEIDKLEKDIKEYIKYKQRETDENLIVKAKDDETLKEDSWNNDVTSLFKHEDLHAIRDNAFEISNKESEWKKQEYEITSREQSLNVDEERGIPENRSKGNEKVISYEGAIYSDTSADKASGGKYKLKEDHTVTNKRKYEADKTKGIGLPSVEEGINETSSKNEKEHEKLSLSKEILGERDFKMKSDMSEDNDKKEVKSNQIFDKNTSSMEENNVLVKTTQLQTDRTLSEITDIAEEGPFVNTGIYEKNNRARVLSAKANTKEKEPFNDPRIHQEIHNTEALENNEIHITRTKERKLNKLSEYETDGMKTSNIKSSRFSNDDIVISKKDDSANKINEILQEDENSEETLLRDSEVNQATNLPSIGTRTGSPTDPQGNDESSTATTEAHVAKLQDENKELRSSGNDTSRIPDEDQIEIRANFGKLNDTDVHAPGYSDRLNKDNNPSPAVRKVSLEEYGLGQNKAATFEGNDDVSSENTRKEDEERNKEIIKAISISNSSAKSGEEFKTAEETRVTGGTKENYETQAANEVDNTLETLNETADQSLINLTGFLSDEPLKEFSSKQRPEENGSVFYDLKEEGNFSDVRIASPRVFIDPNESDQKYTKSDRESIDVALTNIENLEKKYYTKTKIDEASKLNSSIDASNESLIKTKGLSLLGKQKDKAVANDVNSEQTTESSSNWSSKFFGNSGISGEDNISSTAINQGSKEETEKEETTGRNMAEGHSSKHSDLEMISNLPVISSGNSGTEEETEERNSVITDEKLDSDNHEGNLSNVARFLTTKNSAEIMSYYKTEGNGNNFVEYETINKSDREDPTKESEIDISEKSNESSIGITQKQDVMTEKSRLNDSYAKEAEQKASLNESESITSDLNKETAPVEGSNTSIEVTESNDAGRESKESSPTANTLEMSKNKVSLSDLSAESFQYNDKLGKKQHKTLNNSSSGETRSKEDEITRVDTKVNDKYTTPSAARQLIENNVLEAFPKTSTQAALNTSEAHSPDMHENTIKSRLLEAATLRSLNWTDNEGYKDPLVETSRIHKETHNNGSYDSDTMRLSELDPKKKLSEIVKASNEKVESSTDEVGNIQTDGGYDITDNNMKRLKGDEAERVAENIFNGFDDISVESNNEHMGTIEDNKFMNSTVDTSYASVSLNESDYRIDDEVNAKRQEKIDPFYENDLSGVRENENIKNTNATDILDQRYDLNEKYSGLDIYDEDYKPKILTITDITQDRNNLLKNGIREKDPLMKLLLSRANKIQNLTNEIKDSHMSDNSSEKNNEPSEARTKIKLDELNKETSEGKATQESESYEDKLHLSEHRISQSAENLYEISKDGKETQIQKALTEAEIAVTELPRVKEQQQKDILEKEEETYTKAGDKHISSENHLEDPDRRNVSWNQLNSMEITDSKSNDEISLKQHYKSTIQGTSNDLKDIDSEISIGSGSTSNTIVSYLQNKYKDLALDTNDPKKMTYDSNTQDELKLDSKKVDHSEIPIKSYYTSNVTENNLHNRYQNPSLIVTEPLKVAYKSKIENSMFNSKNDTNSSLSIGSLYTSNAIASDLHNTSRDPAMSVSNSKKVIYESYTQDESGLNSKEKTDPDVSVESHYTTNSVKSDSHDKSKNPAISASDSRKVSYESKVKDKSKFALKEDAYSDISVKSYYTPDANKYDLHSEYQEPTLIIIDPLKMTYESNIQDKSKLRLKEEADSGISSESNYASGTVKNDLHNEDHNLTLVVSDPKKLTRKSSIYDETKPKLEEDLEADSIISTKSYSDLHSESKDSSVSANDESVKVLYESSTDNKSSFDSKKDADSVLPMKSYSIWNIANNGLRNEPKDSAATLNGSKKVIHESSIEDDSSFNLKDNINSDIWVKSYFTSNVEHDLHSQYQDPELVVLEPLRITYESKMPEYSILDTKEDTDSDMFNKFLYTFGTVNSNLRNEFRDPTQTDSKEGIERHNLGTVANSENIVENESVQFINDGKTLPIPEHPDHRSLFTISEAQPEVNTHGVNVLSNIAASESPTDAHRSLRKEEKGTKSNNPLFRVSATILSDRDGEEIPDAKFVKKLEPSSGKLAKSWAKIVNKSESSSSVSSKKFKSHSDEAEPARPVKSSSYKTLNKVLGTEAGNNNLCNILRSSFLFTHFRDDARDNEVSGTYDASTGVLPSNIANVHQRKSYESASMLQEPSQDKVDIYIVKQTSEGPVKIAHVENMEPLVVTSDEISKNLYDSMVNIFNRNRIKSASTAT